ncbi:MAG: hypothetical protein WCQ80_04535 [Bacilli bacterium]
MNFENVLNVIIPALISHPFTLALFLMGSTIANQDEKATTLNLACVISPDHLTEYQQQKNEIFRRYQDILYERDVINGPSTIIYEDGTRVNFYILFPDVIQGCAIIDVFYDPTGLLKEVHMESLPLTDEAVRAIIDEFSFTMFEFVHAVTNKDGPFAWSLANQLYAAYTQLYRYTKDPRYLKIPSQGFLFCLNKEEKEAYLAMTRSLKYDNVVDATKLIVNAMQQVIVNLPLVITVSINYVFFEYGKQKILQIFEVKK